MRDPNKYRLIECKCKGRSHVCPEAKGLMRWNSSNDCKVIWYRHVTRGYLVSETIKINRGE